MTYEEFLSALRNTPRDWYLTRAKEIRRGINAGQCPGLACGIFGKTDFQWKVAIAADNRVKSEGIFSEYSPKFDPQIRKDLLSACGISEEA